LGEDDKSALASSMQERQKHHDWQKERRKAFEQQRSVFLGHTRTEQNFVRGSDDPDIRLPPPSAMEIESPYYSRLVLSGYLRHRHFVNIFILSLGWALISGSMGTMISLYHHANINDSAAWVERSQKNLGALLGDFKWLPTFMLGGYLAFYVQRWRQFIFAAWQVEGRLKDLGIIIGSEVRDPDDPATRSLLYRVYRYMVLAMALQYKSVMPQLRDAGPDLFRILQKKGLLEPQETPVLAPQGSRMRDAVLSWIALEVKANGPTKTGLLTGNCEISVMDKLTACRGSMMYFHGNNFYPQPNMWSAFMMMLVDMYCGLMILTYPFKMLTPIAVTRLTGLQPITVLSVFLMTLCFWGAEAIVFALARPFAGRVDTFNMDALIAGTEQTLFASLRAGFDSTARHRKLK